VTIGVAAAIWQGGMAAQAGEGELAAFLTAVPKRTG
jgi:hypothetical protein